MTTAPLVLRDPPPQFQAIVAGDLAEAEEIQTILRSAGIQSELESAVETHPTALADAPQKVLGHIAVDSDGSFGRLVGLPETTSGLVVRLSAVVRSAGGGTAATT